MTEAQERELYEFYQTKQPKKQPEQVAVAMYKSEALLGRKAFSYDEIYSLMRLAGEKELPKALDVLFTQMKKENWIISEQDGFSLKFLARDHVEQKLPVSS